MSQLVSKLICANLNALKPYESARRLYAQAAAGQQQQIWLNANESPYANEYVVDSERFNRYPDCQPQSVISGYAHYSGLNKDHVLVTRGADEGIELLIRTFCTPAKDSIVICPPTYGMYAISAETCNVNVHKAPLNDDFSLDLDAIFSYKDKTNIVFICSPNNPTGTSVSSQQLRAVLEYFCDSALVVIDEAYIEFDWQNSWASRLADYPNLVILRTLSKGFALAGLRCGFTLANPDIIQALLKVIAPYPIPEPVAQIATQALSDQGLTRLYQQVADIAREKLRIKARLKQFEKIELVGDDKANFILFRSAKNAALMSYLVNNSVLIRDQSKQLKLDRCLRITVGSPEQNDRLLSLINKFFEQQETSV